MLALVFLLPGLPAQTLDELRGRAERGEIAAQCDLGLRLIRTPQDPEAQAGGIRWLKQAAAQGDRTAAFYLGLCHATGRGTARDPAAAFTWYEKAAAAGLDIAQFNVGLYCHEGRGVTQDYARAAGYFRQAATQGLDSAQLHLGLCYREGKGVGADAAAAYGWFLKAAEQGNSDAQYYVGLACANAEGVARDPVAAAKWFREAAEQGDPQAQRNLGLLCSMGQGVPADPVEACAWLSLAVAGGEDAGYLEKAAAALTPEQGERVKARVTELSAGIERRARILAATSASERDDRTSFDNPLRDVNSSGSGFFIGDGTYFVTNHHVIDQAFLIRVRTRWQTVTAELVHDDEQNDLAVLRVPRKFPTLPVVASRDVKLGRPVFTLGFPNPEVQGLSPKLTRGEVSSLTGLRDDPRYFQISVPIQPGNSGGPLVDEQGCVVGVITATLNAERMLATTGNVPQNVNYALKSSHLLALLESLKMSAGQFAPASGALVGFEEAARRAEDAAGTVLVY